MYQSVLKTAWKNYGLSQSRGAPPQGSVVICIHMASVWVPFTSEAKEAIAGYDEIIEEAKRALQECGRKLGLWLRKREQAKSEFERRHTFQRYIEEVAHACKSIKGGKLDAEKLKKQLSKIAEEVTGGEETDRILNKKKPEEPQLEYVVERTEEGLKGDVPVLLNADGTPAEVPSAPAPAPAPVETPELIKGATKGQRKKVNLNKPAPKRKKGGKAKAKAKAKKKGKPEKTLFD
jgi:DNA topoisomerase-6 subunit B